VNPRAPIPVRARFKRCADPHAQLLVALGVRRRWSARPRREATRRHRERATELTDAEGGLPRSDPGKLYCRCFAKKAAALPNLRPTLSADGSVSADVFEHGMLRV
jgi:hypothetical protein